MEKKSNQQRGEELSDRTDILWNKAGGTCFCVGNDKCIQTFRKEFSREENTLKSRNNELLKVKRQLFFFYIQFWSFEQVQPGTMIDNICVCTSCIKKFENWMYFSEFSNAVCSTEVRRNNLAALGR